jgi:hypothetical protein
MLLRISLIIALVGGLAAAAVNFVMVQKEITTTITERDREKADKETAQNDLAKTKKDLANTKAKLESTTKELAQTKVDLDTANGKVADLDKKANDLAIKVKETQDQRDKAEHELAQWTQLHVTPQRVLDVIAELKKTITQRDTFIAENALLNKSLKETKDELATIIGKSDIPPLPQGLKGKIVQVDPKYDFVILDIGDDQGVLAKGIMMVARDGRLIGKVQIARVTKNQSVATLIPGWTRGEIREGDEVLY